MRGSRAWRSSRAIAPVRSVLRSSIDQDLQAGIVLAADRGQAVGDGRLLVLGRDDRGDQRGGRRVQSAASRARGRRIWLKDVLAGPGSGSARWRRSRRRARGESPGCEVIGRVSRRRPWAGRSPRARGLGIGQDAQHAGPRPRTAGSPRAAARSASREPGPEARPGRRRRPARRAPSRTAARAGGDRGAATAGPMILRRTVLTTKTPKQAAAAGLAWPRRGTGECSARSAPEHQPVRPRSAPDADQHVEHPDRVCFRQSSEAGSRSCSAVSVGSRMVDRAS